MRVGGLVTNRDHEGLRVQTSVHFILLGFHGLFSLYGSFSCVLPRPNCVMFLWICEFSHSTSWQQIYGVCQIFKDNCVLKDQRNKCRDSCKVVYGLRLVSFRIYSGIRKDLRWLKTVSSSLVALDVSFSPLLSLICYNHGIKNYPIIGEHVVIIFVTD